MKGKFFREVKCTPWIELSFFLVFKCTTSAAIGQTIVISRKFAGFLLTRCQRVSSSAKLRLQLMMVVRRCVRLNMQTFDLGTWIAAVKWYYSPLAVVCCTSCTRRPNPAFVCNKFSTLIWSLSAVPLPPGTWCMLQIIWEALEVECACWGKNREVQNPQIDVWIGFVVDTLTPSQPEECLCWYLQQLAWKIMSVEVVKKKALQWVSSALEIAEQTESVAEDW